MSSGEQKDNVEELGMSGDKVSALKEAMILLAESPEFVLITLDEDSDPIVLGYGQGNPIMLQGLKVAAVFMEEEIKKISQEFDVKKLVELMVSES